MSTRDGSVRVDVSALGSRELAVVASRATRHGARFSAAEHGDDGVDWRTPPRVTVAVVHAPWLPPSGDEHGTTASMPIVSTTIFLRRLEVVELFHDVLSRAVL